MAKSGLLTNNASVKFEIAPLNGSTVGEYVEIPGLQSIPSLGGDPEMVDITTLSDMQFHYMAGIKDYGDLEFQFLYIPASEMASGNQSNYQLAKGSEDGSSKACKVIIGDGTTFNLTGTVAVSLNEAGINEAFTFNITVGLSADITETHA